MQSCEVVRLEFTPEYVSWTRQHRTQQDGSCICLRLPHGGLRTFHQKSLHPDTSHQKSTHPDTFHQKTTHPDTLHQKSTHPWTSRVFNSQTRQRHATEANETRRQDSDINHPEQGTSVRVTVSGVQTASCRGIQDRNARVI